MQRASTGIRPLAAKQSLPRRIYEHRYLYLLLVPPLVYFVVFKYGAMFWLIIAFKNYNAFQGIWASKWVGLKYFSSFMKDPYFWNIVKNTLTLNLLMLVFYFPCPILLSLMVNDVRSRRFKKTVQSITYLPYFLSSVVICGFIYNLVSMDGPINNLMGKLGMSAVPFLSRADWFRPIYILSEVWQFSGWGSIIYLAALTGIDPQLYESASLDGASRWQQTRHISIPGISSVISIQFLLTVGRLLTVGYEKILLLYNGSTYSTADVISTYIYRRGLLNADYSYSAAVSIFQAVIALMLVVAANKVADKIGQTSLW